MSGEITITPGYNFSAGERVTESKLNQLGQPVAQVQAGSIGATELNNAAVIAALGDNLRGQNLALNAALVGDTWDTPAGVSATVGGRKTNARGWFVNPVGAAVDYARVESSPTTGASNLWAIKVTGAASATTVDIGRFIQSDIAAALGQESFTVSAYVKNNTAAALTPLIRIDTASTRDDQGTVSNQESEATTAIPNTEWLRISKTFDGTLISNMENGADIIIRIPDTHLNSGIKSVEVCMVQIEIGDTLTPYQLKTEDMERQVIDETFLVPTGAEFDFAGITAPTGFLMEYGQAVSRTTYSDLLAVLTATTGGTLTSGSPTVTGVSDDLTGLGLVGAPVEGTGIPAATTITAITSTTITLSANATATGAVSDIRIFPHGAGDGSTTYNIPDWRGRVAAGRDDMGGTAATRLTAGSAAALDGTVLGEVGGEEEHQLTEAELAAHGHIIRMSGSFGYSPGSGAAISGVGSGFASQDAGSDNPHTNVQPTGITNKIIKY